MCFLILAIVDQALNRDKIKINDLLSRRNYVYVTDLVNAIIATLELVTDERIFNIGFGYSYSVGKIIEIVQKYSKTDKPALYKQETRQNEISDVVADCTNVNKYLNWECETLF